MSRCRAGDYLLANDRIRVVVQDLQRNLFGIGQFGGQIIDADLRARAVRPRARQLRGVVDRHQHREHRALHDAHRPERRQRRPGRRCIRGDRRRRPARLPEPELGRRLASTCPFPARRRHRPAGRGADRLHPRAGRQLGARRHDGRTTRARSDVQHLLRRLPERLGPGRALPAGLRLRRAAGDHTLPRHRAATRATSWPTRATRAATGVSYGYVHDVPGSSTFTHLGRHRAADRHATSRSRWSASMAPPNFPLAAIGNPGDSVTFDRYFVVGDGSVSSIIDARNQFQTIGTGTVSGTVTLGGSPVAGAQVVVLGQHRAGRGPWLRPRRNVVTADAHRRVGQLHADASAREPTPIAADLRGHAVRGRRLRRRWRTRSPSPPTAATTQNIALPATGASR